MKINVYLIDLDVVKLFSYDEGTGQADGCLAMKNNKFCVVNNQERNYIFPFLREIVVIVVDFAVVGVVVFITIFRMS